MILNKTENCKQKTQNPLLSIQPLNIVLLLMGDKMKEPNQDLITEARELFALMVREGDIEERMNLKIEINDICLRGKFDYLTSVYTPMVASMNGKL